MMVEQGKKTLRAQFQVSAPTSAPRQLFYSSHFPMPNHQLRNFLRVVYTVVQKPVSLMKVPWDLFLLENHGDEGSFSSR